MKHVNPENLSRVELLDHCADLQAKLDAMSASIDMGTTYLQRLLGLTPNEAAILQLMADGLVRTKEQIMTALYWDRIADEEVPEIKIVDVWVCKIRKKIVGTGIIVETMWGRGYWLEGTDKLKKIMAGEEPERDQAAIAAHIGRPMGGFSKAKGEVRDAVLAVIRELRGDDGRARFTSRELQAKATLRVGASTVLREMEIRKHIKIHSAPRPGARSERTAWTVEIA